MAADKNALTPETVAELAPLLKELMDTGQSPTVAFTDHGYSMRVVKPVYESLVRLKAITIPAPVATPAGLTDAEIDVEVRKVVAVPEPVPEPLELPAKG